VSLWSGGTNGVCRRGPYKPKVPINLDKICTRFRVEFVNVFSSSDVERVESGSFSGVDRGTGRSLR